MEPRHALAQYKEKNVAPKSVKTPFLERIIEKNHVKKYEIISPLGNGAMGHVHKVRRISDIPPQLKDQLFAIKVVTNESLSEDRQREAFEAEISIHREIGSTHRNGICGYWDNFSDAYNNYLLLEYCDGGNLSDLIKSRPPFSEPEARGIIYEIATTLLYLKEYNIIHRDLKPGNIFLKIEDNRYVSRIGDFGLACRASAPKSIKNRFCGTPNYIAPETIANYHYNSCRDSANSIKQYIQDFMLKDINFQVDVWSLGVIIWCLFFTKPPFDRSKNRVPRGHPEHREQQVLIYQNILKGELIFPVNSILSEDLINLIRGCLTLDPLKRLTIEEVIKSPWFDGEIKSIHPIKHKNNYIRNRIPNSTALANDDRIIAWKDYHEKWGFTCLFANGTVCTKFNDGSTATHDPINNKIRIIGINPFNNHPIDNIMTVYANNNGNNLDKESDERYVWKRQMLSMFFVSQFKNICKNNIISKRNCLTLVLKEMITEEDNTCFMNFGDIVQLNFNDHEKIVWDKKYDIVTWISKNCNSPRYFETEDVNRIGGEVGERFSKLLNYCGRV